MILLLTLVEPVSSLTQALKYGLINQAITKQKEVSLK